MKTYAGFYMYRRYSIDEQWIRYDPTLLTLPLLSVFLNLFMVPNQKNLSPGGFGLSSSFIALVPKAWGPGWSS